MFEIKYKIFREDVIPIENDEFYGDEGYFFITADEHEYGFFHEKELSSISTSIYQSFRGLLEGVITLRKQKNSTIFISDVEHYKQWLKLSMIGENDVKISKVYLEKWDGTSVIERNLEGYEVVWEDTLPMKVFLKELLTKSFAYLEELTVLNTSNYYITKLQEIICDVNKNV